MAKSWVCCVAFKWTSKGLFIDLEGGVGLVNLTSMLVEILGWYFVLLRMLFFMLVYSFCTPMCVSYLWRISSDLLGPCECCPYGCQGLRKLNCVLVNHIWSFMLVAHVGAKEWDRFFESNQSFSCVSHVGVSWIPFRGSWPSILIWMTQQSISVH